MNIHQQLLWPRLLDLVDLLKQTDTLDKTARNAVITELNTLAEIYDRQFDPADDFKEYVVTALLKSLSKLLENPCC